MKKSFLTLLLAAAAMTASADDFTVYQNGQLAGSVNSNPWWNCAIDMNAANPEGEGTVFVLSRTEHNDGNFCMGLQTADNGNALSGPLHSADLTFKYYATTPCKITVRLASAVESDKVFNVTEDDVNKWIDVTYNVATDYPGVAAGWKEYAKLGNGDCLLGLVVENFTAETKVYVNDVIYKNIDTEWKKPVVERFCPEPAVPSHEATEVVSLLSGAYQAAGGFNIGGWSQATQWEMMKSDNGVPVGHMRNFNYLGWELSPSLDLSGYDYMHVEFYPMTETTFGFTPISPGAEKAYIASSVKVGEWNSYDVPLSYWDNVNFSNVFQIKFDQGKNVEGFIANVYFYKDVNAVKPAYGNTWYGTTTTTASRDGKQYDITIDYELTANENGTLTCVAAFDGDEGLESGHKLHVFTNAIEPAYDKYMVLTYDAAAEAYVGTTDNTAPFILGKAFTDLHFWMEYPGGVVGPKVEGYVFGAANEAPTKDPKLIVSATASDITAEGASIAYSVRATDHFAAGDITVLVNGTAAEANPVVLTGLQPNTEYTYTLQAVATYEGTEYKSDETKVTFKTLRDGATAVHWYGIADGMINNAYYVGEDETMRRPLPVSIDVEAIWNPDQTLTVNAAVRSAKEIVGIVAPSIVAVSEPRHDGQPDHTPMNGTWNNATITTTAIYDEGARMPYFNFDIIYNGGSTTITSLSNKFVIGEDNAPVAVGAPATVVIALSNSALKVGETAFVDAYVKDADGHFVFDQAATMTVDSEAFNIEAGSITAIEKGTATITATCGDLTATATISCVMTSGAQKLDGTYFTDNYIDNVDLIFDGNEGTIGRWDCAETEEHYLVYDLGQMRNVQAVELVWEGAIAKEYTVTLSEKPLVTAPAARANAFDAAGNVVFTVTDGNNDGATVRKIHSVEGVGHNSQFVTLHTTKAYDKTWGIKLREMKVYGDLQPSAVADIAVDAAQGEVEYYNLQGVKIQGELAPGLYIRRQGNTAAKILVK